jgi:hypothetical protein
MHKLTADKSKNPPCLLIYKTWSCGTRLLQGGEGRRGGGRGRCVWEANALDMYAIKSKYWSRWWAYTVTLFSGLICRLDASASIRKRQHSILGIQSQLQLADCSQDGLNPVFNCNTLQHHHSSTPACRVPYALHARRSDQQLHVRRKHC